MNIKLQAWDQKVKEMIQIDDLYWFEENGVRDFSGDAAYTTYSYRLFTGLKDRNDKEIYEFDIIIIDTHGAKGFQECVVCYDKFQAKFKAVPISTYLQNAGNGGWTGYELRYYCEVLGNIFENPISRE